MQYEAILLPIIGEQNADVMSWSMIVETMDLGSTLAGFLGLILAITEVTPRAGLNKEKMVVLPSLHRLI